ncbi:3-oxo-5-alpha-steroid 4-dehydrogenase-like protein [Elsinoe ampelina]|uniref:3-oxo-5-alpha-steroid 4-dehydrogenase-like protein n=1 Tax=Elsinoe ampelina TaxID=302913 RepID=A0A6A6GC79_9PEZI|nr:3-oxo-5-alpha-steroid 4-dehydrogenase-like protein [Elsinoe ampelina]
MPLLPGIIPPSRETYDFAVKTFQYFPLITAFQWLSDYYPAGKSSIDSSLNLPGKVAWAIMETPGMAIVLYSILTIPSELGIKELPWANYTMAALYIMHYIYRAWLFPLLQPSMSPIHAMPFLSAIAFNVFNGIQIGGWVGGYGAPSQDRWAGQAWRIELGMVMWGWSLMGNIFHDDDLREIRRAALRMQKEKAEKEGKPVEGVEKVYMIPKNGLFHYILYPHYLCEWLEWAGFWVIGGWDCVPARTFLINEITTMFPRALAGKRWYVRKFGADKVGNRKAIIPGVI